MTAKILNYSFESNQHLRGNQPVEPDAEKKILVIAPDYKRFYSYFKTRADRRPRYAFRFWEVFGRTPEYCEVVFLGWPKDATAASDIEDYLLAHGWEW